LIVAFNNHPHVVVLPNTKDTLQVKNADGEKVLVRKILTMVGLGTIFSDIVRDNPTIKNTVGERAFWYLISELGCVRQFTHSHKTMCGCTKCVGLQTLYCLLQAKTWCGLMADHSQSAASIAEGEGRCNGEGMGRFWIAYDTVRCN
jgi:hypothetical protein